VLCCVVFVLSVNIHSVHPDTADAVEASGNASLRL
jgi:hypothetical protein